MSRVAPLVRDFQVNPSERADAGAQCFETTRFENCYKSLVINVISRDPWAWHAVGACCYFSGQAAVLSKCRKLQYPMQASTLGVVPVQRTAQECSCPSS